MRLLDMDSDPIFVDAGPSVPRDSRKLVRMTVSNRDELIDRDAINLKDCVRIPTLCVLTYVLKGHRDWFSVYLQHYVGVMTPDVVAQILLPRI